MSKVKTLNKTMGKIEKALNEIKRCQNDPAYGLKQYNKRIIDDNHQLFLDNACKSIDIVVAKLSKKERGNK